MKRDMFGKLSSEIEEHDKAAGLARVGGPFNGPYHLESYIRAARVLVDHALAGGALEPLAMPCVHVQRHAVELMLKSLIAELREYFELSGDTLPPVPARPRRKQGGHSLSFLTSEVERLVTSYGRPVPSELVALAREIEDYEDGDETRWRYGKGSESRSPDYVRTSFPTEITLPVVDWQRRIEASWQSVCMPAPDGSPMTLSEELYHDLHLLHQEAHAASGELEWWHQTCAHCCSSRAFEVETGYQPDGDRCWDCGSKEVTFFPIPPVPLADE
jgi:hypothetical protein